MPFKNRQVPLTGAKILKETKINLCDALEVEAIISKRDNDICQTDLIKMHIAMKPNAAPIVAWSYPLALKHHDF